MMPMRRKSLFLLLLVSTLATTALILLGCHRDTSPSIKTPPAGNAGASGEPVTAVADVRVLNRTLTPEEAKQYAGDAACVSCHSDISMEHSHTGHSKTLQLINAKEHGTAFRSAQKVRDPKIDYTFGVDVRNGLCVMTSRNTLGEDTLPATLALGSGHNGQTFLSRQEIGPWMVLRISYYSKKKQWAFTPLQEPGKQDWAPPAGREMSEGKVVSCLACHVTFLRTNAEGIDLENSHINVGCERCHGPGQSHVGAARAIEAGRGKTPIPMEDLKRAPVARVMQICGPCHATETDPSPGDPHTEEGLPRFQATALERSLCFQKSQALSCATCHNPHKTVGEDKDVGEANCLRCHASPGKSIVHAPVSAPPTTDDVSPSLKPIPAKPCKVNPTTGCVGCHMPTQHIATIPDSRYHNHWIKIWPKQKAAVSRIQKRS